VPAAARSVDWSVPSAWTFEPLDTAAFPAVELAREVGKRGGTASAVFNAANEECVAAFAAGRLPFLGIVDTIAAVVDEHDSGTSHHKPQAALRNSLTLAEVEEAEIWARRRARELCSPR
jgi:1-deoxy-D-xylulose-5-phosphate reductoisomerase